MSPTAQEILKDAIKLSESERASLAAELRGSLKPDIPSQQRTEKEWLTEVERRVQAYRDGQLTAKPAAEVFREIRRKLKK
jgi:putative addiction module component (TIGR02574 family)